VSPSGEQRAGFTLVELLVVVAVIAILASLLLPALSRAKGNAHSATCQNRLKELAISLQLYREDNGSHFPFLFMAADDDPEQKKPCYWFEAIRAYHGLAWTNRAFHCSAYPGEIRGLEAGHVRGSYAYNGWGVNPVWESKLGLGSYSVFQDRHPPVREGNVRVPASMYAMGDSRLVSDAGKLVGMPVMWNQRGYPEAAEKRGGRHGVTYNVLFCDGHVAAVRRRDLTNATATARFFNIDHEPHPEFQN
jgi:prepilin-type N-terminal cleavage/methylation domain-containing protein/prepilin-type processing-associated H-X9-DG protein